jgi:hypothetical protein
MHITSIGAVLLYFFMAAAGGVYFLSKDMRHLKIPKLIAVVHGSIELFGYGWIIPCDFRLNSKYSTRWWFLKSKI